MSPSAPELTVAVPVYCSAGSLGRTIERIAAALETSAIRFEIVLVDDGSPDRSFDVIREHAARDPRVRGLRLAANCGQHTATLCGLAAARGDFVVTLDDDLQNPPEEIAALLAAARAGHDLVFGRWRIGGQPRWRRAAAAVFRGLTRHLLRRPPGLRTSNVMLADGDLARRAAREPVVWAEPGALLLRHARRPGNAWMTQAAPASTLSRYRCDTLLQLAGRIVCHHGVMSPAMLAALALLLAAGAFLAGASTVGAIRLSALTAGLGLAAAAVFCAVESLRPKRLASIHVAESCGGGA